MQPIWQGGVLILHMKCRSSGRAHRVAGGSIPWAATSGNQRPPAATTGNQQQPAATSNNQQQPIDIDREMAPTELKMTLKPKLKPRSMSGGSVPLKRRIRGYIYRPRLSMSARREVHVPPRTSAHGRASRVPVRYTDTGGAALQWRETIHRWCGENGVPFRQQCAERTGGAPLVEVMV